MAWSCLLMRPPLLAEFTPDARLMPSLSLLKLVIIDESVATDALGSAVSARKLDASGVGADEGGLRRQHVISVSDALSSCACERVPITLL